LWFSIKMEEIKEYVMDMQEMTVKTVEKRTGTTNLDVINILRRIPGVSTGINITLIPGYTHLNPELLAAGFIFRQISRKQDLKKIKSGLRDKIIKNTLIRVFPQEVKDKEIYPKLKADFIRYLILMKQYL